MDTLKFFFKIWLYFICFAIGLAFVAWATIAVAQYSFALGLLVLFVGIGGLFSAVIAFSLR
jgi:FtsH-binding integral membrane protein